MHPAYQRLARPDEPRSAVREIVTGLLLLIGVVLAFLFLPALPGEPVAPESVDPLPGVASGSGAMRGESLLGSSRD